MYPECVAAVLCFAVAMQGAEVAVYAATSPSFTAGKSVPLLLHDCKPMTPSVRTGRGHAAQCLLVWSLSTCMQTFAGLQSKDSQVNAT
jgi:hypothetical protein